MKKFSSILICLLMMVTCMLAGCATFSINKVKYYNEVIATVDETKITRFDLLTAYNNYGNSYYVQQMGESESEALKSTLDLLIDRELMYQYALDNNEKYKPTAYQVNELVKSIFDSVDSQMNTYVETAKNILQIESEDVETETTENKTSYALKDYQFKKRAVVKSRQKEKSVYYTDATYTTKSETITEFVKTEYYTEQYIEYCADKEEKTYQELIAKQYLTNFTEVGIYSEIKNKYLDHFLKDLQISEKDNATILRDKAKSLFAKDLIDYEYYLRDEDGKPYEKSTEGLLTRYFERTFKDKIKSQYLENMRVDYLKNSPLNIELLENEFAYLLELQHDKFDQNHELYSTTMKDIGTGADSVLYHPNTDAEFGYFVHALINFDGIKENLTLLENEKDPEKYETQYNILVSNNKIMQREVSYDDETNTPIYTDSDKKVSLQTVIDEYNAIANGSYSSTEEKLSAFTDFMFTYSTDTGTLSAGMPYVIGTNGYSAMEQAFTDEAIKLMEGNPGNMSKVDLNDLDSLCITPYGIHVLFYIGDVNMNDIAYDDRSAAYIHETIKPILDENGKIKKDKDGNELYYREDLNLFNKTLNPLTNETYFDMMFDYIYPANSGEVYTSNNGYSDFEKEIVEQSKIAHKVVKNTTKINSTKTSI